MPDNIEAGDKCQNHESEDDLRDVEVEFNKEVADSAERERSAGPRSQSAPAAVPFADIVRLRKIYLQAERPSSISTRGKPDRR